MTPTKPQFELVLISTYNIKLSGALAGLAQWLECQPVD